MKEVGDDELGVGPAGKQEEYGKDEPRKDDNGSTHNEDGLVESLATHLRKIGE